MNGSLGDMGFVLCESTWFDGRVFQGRKLVGNARMHWVSFRIGFNGSSLRYRRGRQWHGWGRVSRPHSLGLMLIW